MATVYISKMPQLYNVVENLKMVVLGNWNRTTGEFNLLNFGDVNLIQLPLWVDISQVEPK
jgi:hypothetical protein